MQKTGVRALVLVAFARAGKDAAAAYLARRHGYQKIVFSDSLKSELARRGWKPTKTNMSRMGNILRRRDGMGVMARLAIARAKELNAATIVFSGSRSPAEIRLIRQTYPDCKVVEIRSRFACRAARAKKAGWTKEQLRSRDENDSKKKGLAKAIRLADAIIENDHSLADLHQKMDEFLARWK
jgi:dephospho-CoA kinase